MNKALLRTPGVAWPTITLALGVSAGWSLAVAGAFLGVLPLPAAAALACACAYFAFTPMHDAAHRAVGRAPWLNEVVGLVVVLLPARLATAALAFAFDYLPHRPHETPAQEDRYRASHVFRERWLTLPLCGQNYHLVHHLYPAVPFYRYGAVWFDQREALLLKGASERGLFGA